MILIEPVLPERPPRPELPPLFRDIEKRTFQFFWDTTNEQNGMTPDRYPSRPFASVASIGYALTAGIFVLLHRHALKLADALELSASERIRTRTVCARWTGVIVLACASIILALILPMGRDAKVPCDSVPGVLYMLLIPMIRLIVARERRQLAALGIAEPAR